MYAKHTESERLRVQRSARTVVPKPFVSKISMDMDNDTHVTLNTPIRVYSEQHSTHNRMILESYDGETLVFKKNTFFQSVSWPSRHTRQNWKQYRQQRLAQSVARFTGVSAKHVLSRNPQRLRVSSSWLPCPSSTPRCRRSFRHKLNGGRRRSTPLNSRGLSTTIECGASLSGSVLLCGV